MFFRHTPSHITVIHRLHPFTKMGAGIGLSMLALGLRNPLALGILLAFTLAVLVTARIRLHQRQILSLLAFFTVFSALNLLINQNPAHAATYSLRFAIFFTAMPLLSLTTDPQHLTKALAATPLPSGLSMALLLVWRFFPLMAADAKQIRQAALMRDRSKRLRLYRGFLVPLAFSVIEYADRVTLALELRGFSPAEERTCYNAPRLYPADLFFLLLVLGAAVSAAWLQWGER